MLYIQLIWFYPVLKQHQITQISTEFVLDQNVENAKDYEDYIMKARTAGFSDMIKGRFIIGSFSLLAENQDELFRNAQRAGRLIVNELNKFFEVADHLVLPASPSVAPLISSVTTTWSKKPDFVDNHMALANFLVLLQLLFLWDLKTIYHWHKYYHSSF